jgi:hypothetical protein
MVETTLMLRTCTANMSSHKGFKWPKEGWVSCPDWSSEPVCGGGLHGFLMGEGNGGLIDCHENTKWLVCEIYKKEIVDLGGKIKVPRAKVVHVGTKRTATDYLLANGAAGKKVIGCTLEGGDRSTLIGGDWSNLTGGDWSNLTGGDKSTIIGGYRSTIIGGYMSTLTGGKGSTLTGGYSSKLTGGDGSTLTGGNWSTLTGGYKSNLTGGDLSTLTGGDESTLSGGYKSNLTGGDWSKFIGGEGSTLTGGKGSILTGGDGTTLTFTYCGGDKKEVVVIGKDYFKPNVPYRLNEHNIPVEV